MKRLYQLSATLLFLFSCMACEEDDKMDMDKVVVPNGYALSAGTSTIFLNSSVAYDTEADWVSGANASRFNNGDGLYDDVRTSGNEEGGGLGPVYAGYSCGSCHRNAGRTKPTLWENGGSGNYGFSSMLVYITRRNGAFFRDYGRVLHDQAIYGVEAEGKLSVKYEYETFSFPDGETYELCKPTYSIREWYKDSIPLRHVGMGQMMAIDRNEIIALAAKSNYPEYGISGRVNYITEKGVTGVGLSGNKAQHLDLTVELGFSSDMGVTNSRYPEEICEGQIQINQGSMMGLSYDQLDISTEDMEDVDLYMQSLGVPARRNVDDPQVILGEQKFYEAKCHLCHVPTLHTRPEGSVLLNGTRLSWLGGQTIHPYSDYLLHDMGSEIMGVGLNDNYTSGMAQGNEWRTTPLWGIGLQEKVNGHTYFLHDGRARNLIEAIMWHGGEGEASKNLFKRMTKEERDAVIAFLNSL